jgi:hypothetical protein
LFYLKAEVKAAILFFVPFSFQEFCVKTNEKIFCIRNCLCIV